MARNFRPDISRRHFRTVSIHAAIESFDRRGPREIRMKRSILANLGMTAPIAIVTAGIAVSAQDKYAVQVPNGLSFAEFRGYEDWPVIAISENGGKIAVIL